MIISGIRLQVVWERFACRTIDLAFLTMSPPCAPKTKTLVTKQERGAVVVKRLIPEVTCSTEVKGVPSLDKRKCDCKQLATCRSRESQDDTGSDHHNAEQLQGRKRFDSFSGEDALR
jgi:hypothetical protein